MSFPSGSGSRKQSMSMLRGQRGTAIVAIADRREVELLTLVRHTEFAAEIDVMAVRPEYHRHGIRPGDGRSRRALARKGWGRVPAGQDAGGHGRVPAVRGDPGLLCNVWLQAAAGVPRR